MVSLLYRCYIPNSVKVGPVVLEKKILTDDRRLITDDDRLQPNFSDSGDLRSLAVKIQAHKVSWANIADMHHKMIKFPS